MGNCVCTCKGIGPENIIAIGNHKSGVSVRGKEMLLLIL